MNIIYNLAFWLLFQYPFASPITDSPQKLNNNKPGVVNNVYKSTDGGQTWQDISEGLPENWKGGDFFANDSGLHVRAGNWIYHSKPNATAPFWKTAFSPNKQCSIAPGNTDSQFVGTNVGKTWKQAHTGGWVESNGVLLATSQSGILRSTDDGENWDLVISEGG